MNKIIEVTNLYKNYGSNEVLKNLNLEVYENEFIAIKGKSGSGKSTLLNILGTLDNEYRGDVFIGGQNLKSLSSKRGNIFRNRNIGFVFQFPNFLKELNVLENVILPRLLIDNYNLSIKKGAEILDRLSISHLKTRDIQSLSGGEKQRVSIARAIINDPQILLSDEPTGNLDNETSEEIAQVFKDLNKNQGYTILVITHSNELASIAKSNKSLFNGQLL